ncbi:GH36-type glycosyl hydrolase domain-containing protein [Promineifilum sp.]|uniref:GH36-type glycosyl hydrolase domain-containing protein n=1 Tax=Promineifilum sp. TaxID=2664178 RepID=UPI0035B1D61E
MLEKRIGYRPPWRGQLGRWAYRHPALVYMGGALAMTALIVAILAAYAASASALAPSGRWGAGVWLAALLSLIPATAVVVAVLNWAVTGLTTPRVLPKLDFEDGVPAACRTMVVIPGLFTSAGEVDSLLSQLELHYLRNADPALGFALLTDFADDDAPEREEDETLLARAIAGIQMLNKSHARQPFYLFHRRRLWNPKEGKWMGWERKRGKLHEFNALLRGASHTSFIVREGDLSALPDVRYVITLDADTVLPRDAARRLIGALAHPLNQAQIDPQTRRVVDGYAILQPRTEILPTSASHSLFTRVFGGDTGLDLYTHAVSDVYQDLFGEGSYVGKGIYDVDAFEYCLAGRVPENRLLSHDLFEGSYARAGLASDVVLYEQFPSHYLVHIRRTHRWIRGDWQLLPWLLPWTPAAPSDEERGAGHFRRNDLSLLGLWRIADNLRRSLLAPALFALLVAGWTVLPGSPLVWTAVALLAPAIALLIGTVTAAVRALVGELLGVPGASWRDVQRPLRDGTIRWLLQIAFLPFETVLVLDAVLTTLWRLIISRRNLLQWVTAAHTEQVIGRELSVTSTRRTMLPSILLTLAALGLVIVSDFDLLGAGAVTPTLARPVALAAALPVIVLWLLAARIAHWVSRPDQTDTQPLSDAEIAELRQLARRTWLFYEQYVGPADHWLPPDNYQEWPRGIVGHRTSPTNIGLYLLTAVSAWDLGYISLTHLTLRLRSAFEALETLERYRGHFLNWITTDTLRPLYPRYISTVDSGNLAASLMVLQQACLEATRRSLWHEERWAGLLDVLALTQGSLRADGIGEQGSGGAGERGSTENGSSPSPYPLAPGPYDAVRDGLETMRARIETGRSDPRAWIALAIQLAEVDLPKLERAMIALFQEEAERGEWLHEWRVYVDSLRQNVRGIKRDLDLFFPWRPLLDEAPEWLDGPDVPDGVPAAHERLLDLLAGLPTPEAAPELLAEAAATVDAISARLANWRDARAPAGLAWCRRLNPALHSARLTISSLREDLTALSQQAIAFADGMEFSFLFNERRQVFHIGYNLENDRLDDSYYDLLASEARIASIVAIAKGDVPQSHWLHLSRPLAQTTDGLALLSWSGTMFEYLMPPLLMRNYRGTLLERSLHAVIHEQIQYAAQRGVPWGISESGFYAFDNALNYQYRAFGVPGLGFKRGLGEDLVIAPYASLLALAFRPRDVLDNIARLRALGAMGPYGLYEAVDFTNSRTDVEDGSGAIVRSYMAHHQGMIMLSLLNFLRGDRMTARFHADPRIQSVELLLQEQLPPRPQLEQPHSEDRLDAPAAGPTITADPWLVPVVSPMPQAHVLSNGRFNTLITNAGGGYSALGQDYACTRWRADTTLDEWGCWLYVQDLDRGQTWSATVQPVVRWPEAMEVQFYPHMALFRRRDFDIALQMEVIVSPDENVEVRRITLTNDSDEPRRLRLTSYGEVVLTDAASDRRHQAFAKLFIESEYVAEVNSLFFRRRPRSSKEDPHYLGHMLAVREGELTRAYESDRAAFLGRGRAPGPAGSVGGPAALVGPEWLSGSVGATLDPIMSLGQEVALEPRSSVEIALITFTAYTREELLALAERYRRWSVIERVRDRARNFALRELRQLDMPIDKLAATQKLLSLLLYPHAALRAGRDTLAANRHGQTALWPYGISGDHPILLFLIEDESAGELLQEALRAHKYWRARALPVELVILNRRNSSYEQPLQAYIGRLINRAECQNWLNRRGGIFMLREDQMSPEHVTLLLTAARVILDGAAGTLDEQLARLLDQPPPLPDLPPTLAPTPIVAQDAYPASAISARDAYPVPQSSVSRPEGLLFDNGYGGFSPGGTEYVIYVQPEAGAGEQGSGGVGGKESSTEVSFTPAPLYPSTPAPPLPCPPAPWINVIANEQAGFLISESGGGYTWAINSGENRLTTWRNDPVTDTPAEALYLRDEETVEVWSPLPQPTPADGPYLVRHGLGYTVFEHHSHQVNQSVRLFMAPDDPVKIIEVRLENTSDRPRRLTLTLYAEWVLGVSREESVPFIIPTYRQELDALLARNPYNAAFGQRVAFVAACKRPHGVTTDRMEFLGRLGSVQRPAALRRIGLSNRVEPGLDPCAVIQLHVDLPVGEDRDVPAERLYFLIGQGEDEDDAIALIARYRDAAQVEMARRDSAERWERLLTTVQVETPDPAMNLLLNRWLLYQTLSCRVWGRSALYQSSGAYGFRDQLQDVMALVHTRPDLARAHILRAAAHQFERGDVLHWWHPSQSGMGDGGARGVRTRISDDLAWLPYVTAYYVATSGDAAILDETAPFLIGPPLEHGEEERYGHFERSLRDYSLYEHCLRALRQAATEGRHGLPLIGAGDWNDGMNRVGAEGQGESIWLAWFLYRALLDFAELCEARGGPESADAEAAAQLRERAEAYRAAVEQHGWDGAWYRRAYYDEGAPLGSQQSAECKIDSIAQSWAVLSGAADPQRARRAMQSVADMLVDDAHSLLLLFTPPFDRTPKDPGYIKGYLPGVRENGGQYSHAAMWAIWACAELGDGAGAERLFRLVNPIYHADTTAKADTYKVEPYVVAADVYSLPAHRGRGGWTWYTGSAAWMYRLGVEGLLGLQRRGDRLRLEPRIPPAWNGFRLTYRYGETRYHFDVRRAKEIETEFLGRNSVSPLLIVDGMSQPDGWVALVDDSGEHQVEVILPDQT